MTVVHHKNLPRCLDSILPSEIGNARTSSPSACLNGAHYPPVAGVRWSHHQPESMSRAIPSQGLWRVTPEASGDSSSCLGLVKCKISAPLFYHSSSGVFNTIPASLEALFWDHSQSWSFRIGEIAAGGMLKAVLLSSFPHLSLLLHRHKYMHTHLPNTWASPALSWLHTAMQSAQFAKSHRVSKSARFEWKRSLHLSNTQGQFDAVPLSDLD